MWNLPGDLGLIVIDELPEVIGVDEGREPMVIWQAIVTFVESETHAMMNGVRNNQVEP